WADDDPGAGGGAMHTREGLGEGGLVSMGREIWRGNRFVALLVCDARLVAPARTALLLGPVPARCAAAAALAALGDWRATPALASPLRRPGLAVRAAAAHRLRGPRRP